ncbi:MAG: AAA family ATPase, partial [Patescibacteria group bacterium]|nr:AAA family ATPase [Patescibacteria group bacterium]
MKIKSIKLENFAKYSHIEVSFDKNITYLIGNNGAGKTTLGLDAIWFLFQGIAEKSSKGNNPFVAERFRFIGENGASAKGEMVLVDETKGTKIKVTRKLTKDGTSVSFESLDKGLILNQEWLNDLFNVFLISPRSFLSLDSKKQAEMLGIDTSKFDTELESLMSEHTYINRELKSIGTVEEVLPVDEVDIESLIETKNNMVRFNTNQTSLEQNITRNKEKLKLCELELNELIRQEEEIKQKIDKLKNKVNTGQKYIASLPQPEKLRNMEQIDNEIKEATQNNNKNITYQNYLQQKQKHTQKLTELNNNKKKQSEIIKNRIDYIRSKKLPFDNLEINENGELLLSGKPIKEQYFATGELLKIVPVLISSLNPELKYVFIQQFNLLDEKQQKIVEEYLVGKGFQLVAEIVGEKEVEN